MSSANVLRTILIEKLRNDSLVLPTLPRIAMEVRETVANPDSNLNQISTLISHDAALSARIIRLANTAHFSRAVKVDNLQAAVTRIGMRQIKNVVMALAMEQLFVSENEFVSIYLANSWKNSTDVAAYAMTLFSIYKKNNKHTALQIDTLTLTALLHNIGVLPILTEADSYPEVFASPEFLKKAVDDLHCHISVAIVKAWNFSDEMIESIRYYAQSDYQTDDVSYLDFVRLAVLCQRNEADLQSCEVELTSFIDKGVISSIDSVSNQDFKEELAASKATFE